MTYNDFLAQVIREGIMAAAMEYNQPAQVHKLQGSLEGFESCYEKPPEELGVELLLANEAADRFFWNRDDATDKEENLQQYWRFRCKALEIEYVCNVVSAMLMNEGLPTIIQPTSRGVRRAAEIIGVKS